MKGKCLIVGANGGMGQAIMLKMLNKKYQVVGTYHRSNEHLRKYEKNVDTICLDLKDIEKFDFGNPKLEDITDIVFTAGKECLQNIVNCSRSDMFEQYNINVFSPLLIVQKIMQRCCNSLRNIVFISSSAASDLNPANGVYALSKACLCNLVKMLDSELKSKGIRVNCIVPGWCETEMAERISVAKGYTMSTIKANKLQNELVKTEEIAEICMFLISDSAKNIHGQFIGVDVPEKEL